MTTFREIPWHTFEETLALAMGWPLDEAKARVLRFDSAAGELPFEFPDPIDELVAQGALQHRDVLDDSASYAKGTVSDEPNSPAETVPMQEMADYLYFKKRLKEAIKHDIEYHELREDDGWTVLGYVLNPAHVSRWLNVMQYRDMSKLHERIAELEKENTRLRKELQQEIRYDEQITAEYLNIAIQTYYKTWHDRDVALATPSQEAIWSELHDDYPHLSEVTRKAIEKVICPIERNPAKRKKA